MRLATKNLIKGSFSVSRSLNRLVPHRLFQTKLAKKILVCRFAPLLWKYGMPPVDTDKPGNIYDKIDSYEGTPTNFEKGNNLKVTMLIGTLGPGGSERQAVHLALELKKRDIEVEFLTIQNLEASKAHYLPLLNEFQLPATSVFEKTAPNLDYSKLDFFKNTQDLPTPLYTSYRVATLLKKNQPNILHCWLDETNIWGAIAGIITGIPGIIVSTRSVNPTYFSKNYAWTRRWYRRLLNNPHVGAINNSKVGARDYAKWLGVEPARFQVINNGLVNDQLSPHEKGDTKEKIRNRFGLKEEKEIILGAMRFTKEKRPLLFIQTCLLILKKRPQSIAVLIGDGPMFEEIKRTTEKSGMQNRIILVGTSKEVSKMMDISDLFILTSRYEGSPNVLIEAQNSGCPVLTTAAGGAVDTIIDGKTGFIVPDKPDKIAQKACTILEDQTLKSSLKAAGPPFVAATFSMDRMVNQTLKLYHSVFNYPKKKL